MYKWSEIFLKTPSVKGSTVNLLILSFDVVPFDVSLNGQRTKFKNASMQVSSITLKIKLQ